MPNKYSEAEIGAIAALCTLSRRVAKYEAAMILQRERGYTAELQERFRNLALADLVKCVQDQGHLVLNAQGR